MTNSACKQKANIILLGYLIINLLTMSQVEDKKADTTSSVVATQTPEVKVESVPVTTVEATTVVTEKKGGGGGKCFLIGCCLIISCCVLTICGLGAMVYFGGASVLSSNKAADPTLTRIANQTEAEAAIEKLVTKENTIIDETTGDVTMSLSEEELLAMVIDGMQLTSTPEKVGVKITTDSLKMEFDLGALVKALNETNSSSENIEISGLDNIFAGVSLGVGSDGKSIVIKDFSVGNSVIDAILGASFKDSMNQSLKENFENTMLESGLVIQKIELQTGKVAISFSEVAMPTDTPDTTEMP